MKRVLLINMPFAAIAFPSIALGLFKARFQKEGIPCHVEHLNILFAEMVGGENYNSITEMSGIFAGEQMFSHVLFGNSIPDDITYYNDILSQVNPSFQYRLSQMRSQVIPFLALCMERIPWHSYDIIGFTCLFEQNIPSLALAYQIKKYFPDKIIVFGGSNCEDTMGLALHKYFQCIDYVFTGEADDTFPEFVKRLSCDDSVHNILGIVFRQDGKSIDTGDSPKTHNMDTLPYPDYDDYFKRLSNSYLSQNFRPFLLFETSRGCWWGEKVKCAFCGLNGKNMAFRSKSSARVIDELSYLIRRYYQIEYVQVIDNVLNHQYFDDVLPEIGKMKLNVKFYFEIRPTLGKEQIKMLADAGSTLLQAGIENLSQHILKLIRKGTTSLHNIRLLKWCKQYGVNVAWNIIYGFPGEVPQDYNRIFELSRLIIHFHPPSCVGPFRLDRFSRNFDNAEELGLINIRPEKIYNYIYPFDNDVLFDLVYHFDYDYQKPIDDGGYRLALENHMQIWKNYQFQCYSQRLNDKLVIYDNRPIATAAQISLYGIQGYIYEYCDDMKNIRQIKAWLKNNYNLDLDEDQIKIILDEFVEKKLMVKEKNLYLSLAIMTYTPEYKP
jgi:ribosomal peptide maturation radical SAM protein 1